MTKKELQMMIEYANDRLTFNKLSKGMGVSRTGLRKAMATTNFIGLMPTAGRSADDAAFVELATKLSLAVRLVREHAANTKLRQGNPNAGRKKMFDIRHNINITLDGEMYEYLKSKPNASEFLRLLIADAMKNGL